MRILEIGEGPYVSVYAPGITDFFSTHKATTHETRLTLKNILLLRQRLKGGRVRSGRLPHPREGFRAVASAPCRVARRAGGRHVESFLVPHNELALFPLGA